MGRPTAPAPTRAPRRRPTETPRTWDDKQGRTHTVGSEVNLTGIGGGSVVTIDDIAFGDGGLPRPQRIPARGPTTRAPPGPASPRSRSSSSLLGRQHRQGAIVAVNDGLVFNVDGQVVESCARVNDKAWSCDKHPTETGTGATDCTNAGHDVNLFYCTCGEWLLDAGTALACTKCSAATQLCSKCSVCGSWLPLVANSPCTIAPCAGKTAPGKYHHSQKLQELGTAISSTSVDPALDPSWSTYFKTKGTLLVYDESPSRRPRPCDGAGGYGRWAAPRASLLRRRLGLLDGSVNRRARLVGCVRDLLGRPFGHLFHLVRSSLDGALGLVGRLGDGALGLVGRLGDGALGLVGRLGDGMLALVRGVDRRMLDGLRRIREPFWTFSAAPFRFSLIVDMAILLGDVTSAASEKVITGPLGGRNNRPRRAFRDHDGLVPGTVMSSWRPRP